MELNIAGSGACWGWLLSQEAEVNIAGSGEVELRVQERLKIDIAGAARSTHGGIPSSRARSRGSGQVSRSGELSPCDENQQ